MLTIARNNASLLCIDNKLEGMLEVNATCLFYPERLTPRVRNAVLRHIDAGLCTSYSGTQAAVFSLLTELRGCSNNYVTERWMGLNVKPGKLAEVESDLSAFLALHGVRYDNNARSYGRKGQNIFCYGVLRNNKQAALLGIIDIVSPHLTITDEDKDWMRGALNAPVVNLRYNKVREVYQDAG